MSSSNPIRPENVCANTPNAPALGLTVDRLRVVFGHFVAVDDASFEVPSGQSFGIVGESGSGKSTILRALCGLAPITSGSFELTTPSSNKRNNDANLKGIVDENEHKHSQNFDKASKINRQRTIQMVFQDPYASLHPRQTIDRQLAEPLAIHGIADANARIAQALEEVGLGNGFRFRYPHQLSGGQRQRVAVARALILEPQVLLLDEPTSALDASVQAEVLNLLCDLRDKRGLTFVMVSHDLAVVAHMCERLIVMQKGQIVETLNREQLHARSVNHPYTQNLMHASLGFVRQKTMQNG